MTLGRGRAERKKSAPLTRQEETVRRLGALKALECQAKDLSLDVVVSSREL